MSRLSRFLERKAKSAYYRGLYSSSLIPVPRIDRYLSLHHTEAARLFVNTEALCFIYCAMPKVGSQTIEGLILDVLGHPPPPKLHMTHRLFDAHRIKHLPDMEESKFEKGRSLKMTRHYYRDPENQWRFDGVFKFTFVRNPYARLVSCYCNKVLGSHPNVDVQFARTYPSIHFERMSFADFVRFVCCLPDDLCDKHFRPQSELFDDDEVDFVGRLEHFSDDLAQVIKRLGLDERFLKWCNIKKNKTQNQKHYTEFYDAETQAMVAEKYRGDIRRFNYRFEE